MVKVFLSHSSSDAQLAGLLVDLLRAAFNLSSDEVRCTSVPGYRLSAGANIDEKLRQEVFESVTFIGLLSQSSLRSTYVLFELGARWGAKKHFLPLLTADVKIHDLKPPLSGLNVLRCDNKFDLYQLVHDLGGYLKIDSFAAYEKHIEKILEFTTESLSILRPYNGEAVPHRPIVQGKVRNLRSEVWLIVHPFENPQLWVQPKAKIKSDGKWKAQIFIGRVGTEDIGTYYEVRAVVNPQIPLKEGDILDEWPPAESSSDILELLRV